VNWIAFFANVVVVLGGLTGTALTALGARAALNPRST
jgi:hypothetical protein